MHEIRYILKRCVSPQARHVIQKSVQKIVSLLASSDAEAERLLAGRAELRAHDCYQAAVSHFRTHCFNWHSSTVRPGAAGRRTPPSLGPQSPSLNLKPPKLS